MSRAWVSVIIVVAAVLAAFLIILSQQVWVWAGDGRRAKRLGLPFAGRAKMRLADPSLVAPELGRSIRNFRVPRLTEAFHRSTIYPSGVLAVDTAGGEWHLAWEPDAKSQHRGARRWRLKKSDIDTVRVDTPLLNAEAHVAVTTVDRSRVWLIIASATRLCRALAEMGVVLEEPPKKSLKKSTRPIGPAAPVPGRSAKRGLLRPVSMEEMQKRMAALTELMAEAKPGLDDRMRQQLRSIPSLSDQTRTWEDVADFLGLTPRDAWNLLKDDPPAELARLGLSGADPPPDEPTPSRGRSTDIRP